MWWTISFRFADRRTVSWNKQNLDIWVNCPENIGGGGKSADSMSDDYENI